MVFPFVQEPSRSVGNAQLANSLYSAELLHFLDIGQSTDCFFLVKTTDSSFCSATAIKSPIGGQTPKVTQRHHHVLFVLKKYMLEKLCETQALGNIGNV